MTGVPPDQKTPVIVLAAGSLRNAFPQVIDLFRQAHGVEVKAEYGPAGFLREKIEDGAQFDLFASASMEHPQRLRELGIAHEVTLFTRNRLCVIARKTLAMTPDNMLSILLDPKVTLGTSTPKIDPSGDYAHAFFAMVNGLYPGKGDILTAKAKALVGGRVPTEIPPGYTTAGWLISEGLVDTFISYASNGSQNLQDHSLTVLPLPDTLAPVAEYGVTLRVGASSSATAFQKFLLASKAQKIFEQHGFSP